MNVEIGTEAAQFPEKEYKMGFSLQCTRTSGISIYEYLSLTASNTSIQMLDPI